MTTTPIASPELPDLDKLEALAHAATPGRWMRLFGERTVYDRMEDGCRGNAIVRADLGYGLQDTSNLDFIAAANPSAVLALIALARRAQPDGEAPQAEPMQRRYIDELDAGIAGERWLDQHRAGSVKMLRSDEPTGGMRPPVKWVALFDRHDRLTHGYMLTRDIMNWTHLTLIAPAATLSPLCGAQHAESGEEAASEAHDELRRKFIASITAATSLGENAVWGLARQLLGDAVAALAAQQAAAPGYKLVPIEPTPEMQQAGHDTAGAHMYNASYRAMVAAAPGNSPEIPDGSTSAPGTPEAPRKTGKQLYQSWQHAQPDRCSHAPWYRLDDETKAEWDQRADQLDGGQEGSAT